MPAGEPTPASGTVLPGARAASRSEERRRRKQARRNRIWAVLAVFTALALVAGGAWWWTQRDAGGGADGTPAARTERTVAMVLAEPQEPVLDGVLLVADAEVETGSGLLVQNRLFVDGVASEPVPFGETTIIGPLGTPGDALAVTLDALVDGTWQLTPDGLAALVDAVGPITVDVDVEVTGRSPSGQTVVVLPAGNGQEVGGADAVAFATYRAPGEPEESRLARFSQVLSGVLAALPADPADTALAIDALQAQSRSTMRTADLAEVLVALGSVVRAGEVRLQALPVVPIETGGPVASFALDETAWESIRATQLAGSLPPEQAGGDVRVLVENGVGTPGIEQDAARMLRKEGFIFVNGGNANRFDYEKSVVLIPDATAEHREQGVAVARALGLPTNSVRLATTGQQVAEVIVIIGADFKPDG